MSILVLLIKNNRRENEKGNNVSSGVYFYKLIFNDSIYTKKLLMLK